MIGVLGIGQAGGNVAKEAAKVGFLTAAINTSPEDLQSISGAVKHLYHVPGEVGAGKDRSVGKRVVVERYEEMIAFVSKVFGASDIRALCIAYSLGGGTGSSIGPFLGDILTEALGKTVFFVGILPHNQEAASAQVNAVEAFAELSGIEKAGATFLVDNEQVVKMYPNASKQELYDTANRGVVSDLLYLVNMVTKSSAAGNFDRKDLAQVLATRGFALMGRAKASVTVKDLSAAKLAIARNVWESWESSIYTPVEYQGIGPVRAAVLYEGPEGVTRHIDPAVIFSNLGEPFELFEGTYPGQGEGVITTLLTGLPWPVERMRKVEEELEAKREVIERQIQTAYGGRFESKVGGLFAGIKQAPALSVVKPKEESIAEKLKRYAR